MHTDIIKIDSAPARLGANFAEVRERLAAELAKYEILVTEETVGDAKKLATELNATAKTIDDRRKAEVAKVSEPIRQFDEQMKSLVTMCKDGREKILVQVKDFEDKTRALAEKLLREKRDALWDASGVDAEFRKAQYADLVMITAVTKAGNLSAKALNDLTQRVNADKALQDRTAMRLLALENASYKAGLSAPLTRDHVAGFLFADDAAYAAELDRIMKAELVREEEAQRRMRERLEREQREAADRRRQAEEAEQRRRDAEKPAVAEQEKPEEEPLQDEPEQQVVAEEETANKQTEKADQVDPAPGRVRVTVVATFSTEVPPNATDAAIKNALTLSLQRAGITTLQGIQILREGMQQEAA